MAVVLALVSPTCVLALDTPPESPVVECGEHVQAMEDVRDALEAGDRIGAIRELRRAQAALRACSIRSEAEEIAFG